MNRLTAWVDLLGVRTSTRCDRFNPPDRSNQRNQSNPVSASDLRSESDTSGVAFPADGHIFGFDDDRHFATAAGVLQHLCQVLTGLLHVDVFECHTPILISFPSLLRVGSRAFAENQHFFAHNAPSLPDFGSNRRKKSKSIQICHPRGTCPRIGGKRESGNQCN